MHIISVSSSAKVFKALTDIKKIIANLTCYSTSSRLSLFHGHVCLFGLTCNRVTTLLSASPQKHYRKSHIRVLKIKHLIYLVRINSNAPKDTAILKADSRALRDHFFYERSLPVVAVCFETAWCGDRVRKTAATTHRHLRIIVTCAPPDTRRFPSRVSSQGR